MVEKGDYMKVKRQIIEEILKDYRNKKIKIKDLELLGEYEEAENSKNLICRIDNAMNVLNENEKKLINLRFIEGDFTKSWKEISMILHLSVRRCHEIRENALDKLADIIITAQKPHK